MYDSCMYDSCMYVCMYDSYAYDDDDDDSLCLWLRF